MDHYKITGIQKYQSEMIQYKKIKTRIENKFLRIKRV